MRLPMLLAVLLLAAPATAGGPAALLDHLPAPRGDPLTSKANGGELHAGDLGRACRLAIGWMRDRTGQP